MEVSVFFVYFFCALSYKQTYSNKKIPANLNDCRDFLIAIGIAGGRAACNPLFR